MGALLTDPILTRIEIGMKEAIEGMKPGTYNFDWGTVNEPDMAKQDFPSALITVEEEENVDEESGASALDYLNVVRFLVVVRARLQEEHNIPLYEINKELNLALDDLKKLFGITHSVAVGACDQVMYEGMTREIERSGDLFIPKRMITRWRVDYSQDRSDPTQNGD